MPPTPRPARASAALILSLVVNAALAAGVGYFVYAKKDAAPGGTIPGGGPAPAGGAGGVNALGRVQPRGGVVSVGGVPGDRVTKLHVKLGDPVEAGKELLELSGRRERELALAALDAQLKEAETVRAAAADASREKLLAVDAEVAQALDKADGEFAQLDAKAEVVEIQLARAAKELARLEAAKTNGAPIADQDLVTARSLVAQAEAERRAVKVQRDKATSQRAAAKLGADAQKRAAVAETARAVAMVPVDSLRAARATAAQKLADSVVRAPVAGTVVKIGVQQGDTLGMLPAVQIADTREMMAIAEVYETDIPRLREWVRGRSPYPAKVDARVLGGAGQEKLSGTTTLDRIAPMIARNQVFALGPREDADRRVVEVEVLLGPNESKQVADLIGLQVRVEFDPPVTK